MSASHVRVVDVLYETPRMAKQYGRPDIITLCRVTVPVFAFEDGTTADKVGVNHHEYTYKDDEEWVVLALNSLDGVALWNHDVPEDVAESAIKAVKKHLKVLDNKKQSNDRPVMLREVSDER